MVIILSILVIALAVAIIYLVLENQSLNNQYAKLDSHAVSIADDLVRSRKETHEAIVRNHALMLKLIVTTQEKSDVERSLEMVLSNDLENNQGAGDVSAEISRNGVSYIFRFGSEEDVDPITTEQKELAHD